MGEPEGGYVAVWRQVMDSSVWQLTPVQYKAYETMLLLANFRADTWVCPRCKQKVEVPRGGFCHSPQTIAGRAGRGVSRDVVIRTIANLRKLETLRRHSGRTGCHQCYVFEGYGKFNPTKSGPHPARFLPASGPLPDRTLENQGNHKPKTNTHAFPDDHPGWSIARDFYAAAVEAGVMKSKPDFESRILPKWVDTLDKLHRIDKQPWDLIRRVCEWIPTDRGDGGRWKGWSRIATPGTLRAVCKNEKTKFENCVDAMGERRDPGHHCRGLTMSHAEAEREARELALPFSSTEDRDGS